MQRKNNGFEWSDTLETFYNSTVTWKVFMATCNWSQIMLVKSIKSGTIKLNAISQNVCFADVVILTMC